MGKHEDIVQLVILFKMAFKMSMITMHIDAQQTSRVVCLQLRQSCHSIGVRLVLALIRADFGSGCSGRRCGCRCRRMGGASSLSSGVEDLGFEHGDRGAGGDGGEDSEFVGFDEDLVDFGLGAGRLGWVRT
jgi:hypothetical protein